MSTSATAAAPKSARPKEKPDLAAGTLLVCPKCGRRVQLALPGVATCLRCGVAMRPEPHRAQA